MDFYTPITKKESAFGIAYIFFHTLILPFLIGLAAMYAGFDLSDARFDLVYYIISAALTVIFMRSFIRENYAALVEDPLNALGVTLRAFAFYYLSVIVLSLLLGGLVEDAGPNQEALEAIYAIDPVGSIITGVLLAPVAEELMFRGALFGTLRRRSRLAAYAVTVFLFAFYHLWDSFLFDFSPELFVHLVFYMAPGAALCYAYESSGTIYAPLILHMVINLLSSL